MDISEILRIRLHNQLLAIHAKKEAHEIVSYLGAMQSQAFELAKWAIGVRLKDATVKKIDDALSKGQIIRTHILRPTWHFVAAEDIHWMRELSAPRLKPIFNGYGKILGADESIISKATHKVVKILEKHSHQTKQQIGEHLKIQGFTIDQYTLTHLMSYCELDGIVCNGKINGSKHTYALLEEQVPKIKPFIKEEALERLAYKFFSSHAPATLEDFVWWSGMLITDARKALELVKEHFVSQTINGRTFWMKNDIQIPEKENNSVLLLPPFDEFVVSYKNRSEIIEDKHYSKVMTKNGLFDPTIMLNGEIIGSWRKSKKKNGIQIELSFFEKTTKKIQDLFEKEVKRLEMFYN
jgi:hypothetical protein